ncbi:MAG: hypothetical protein IKP86_02980, partial [Anaerolineaceae bacterium]|nr:hypothetical protein [Anaerolineaceae bacterium]
ASKGLFMMKITDLKNLLSTEAGIPAIVRAFSELPASRNSPLLKAFPDAVDAAKAVIALKNYRKL